MSDRGSNEGHPRARLAAEIGVGSAAAVAAGALATASFLRHHRRKVEMMHDYDPVMSPHYNKSLEVFQKVRPELGLVMAALAVRIHSATESSSELVITGEQLMAQLSGTTESVLHISQSTFNDAIGHLKDNQLVERRAMQSDHRVRGYASLPALRWGLEGDYPLDVLTQAQYELLVEG